MQTQNLFMTGREDWPGRTGGRLGAGGQPQVLAVRRDSELLAPKRLPRVPEVSEPETTEHHSETQSPLGFRIPSAFPPHLHVTSPAYHVTALPPTQAVDLSRPAKSGCPWICLNQPTYILLNSDLLIKNKHNQIL